MNISGGGTLQLGATPADRLPNGATVSIATSGTLAMGSDETVNVVTVNAGIISGTGTLTADTYSFTGGTNIGRAHGEGEGEGEAVHRRSSRIMWREP